MAIAVRQAPALTREEKVAGRRFRAEQSDLLLASVESDPPVYIAPNFLAIWRHECPGRRNVSSAIELKEVYVLSPAYYVFDGEAYEQDADVEGDPCVLPEDVAKIPAGRFGFIYKTGRCRARGCEATVRSRAGRLVDAYDRPPVEGRVARQGK